MPDNSGGMGFLGFVVGGVIVALGVIVFVLYGGQGTGHKMVHLDLPKVTAPQ